jgi:hypothetical protein
MLLHLLWLWVLYWRGLHLFISEFVGVSRGCCGASGVQECFIVLVMRLGLPKSYVGCFQRLHAKRYVCIWWIIGIGRQSRWRYLNPLYVTVCHLRCPFLQVVVLGVLLRGSGEGLDWPLGPVGWQEALQEAWTTLCGVLVSIVGFRCVFWCLLNSYEGLQGAVGGVGTCWDVSGRVGTYRDVSGRVGTCRDV